MAESSPEGVRFGADSARDDDMSLTLRLTTHPVDPVPSNHAMTVSRTASVLDIKTRIAQEWAGKPKAEGIVCVQGGRVCRDAEVVGDLFSKQVRGAVSQ